MYLGSARAGAVLAGAVIGKSRSQRFVYPIRNLMIARAGSRTSSLDVQVPVSAGRATCAIYPNRFNTMTQQPEDSARLLWVQRTKPMRAPSVFPRALVEGVSAAIIARPQGAITLFQRRGGRYAWDGRDVRC